jgi:rod shape-determining protein MreB
MGWDGVLLGRDLAIDLGTANTLVYTKGRGVVLDEPSVISIDLRSGALLSVGTQAKEMLGRTPQDVGTLRPLSEGAIADFEATEDMLRQFIATATPRRSLARPRVVICVPSGVTGVERRAVEDAGYSAGARKVYLLEEPMAAAIGAGLPVHESAGSMVVDIGGGTTEIAVLTLGGIATSLSIRVGGLQFDEALASYIKTEYSLLLGERTSERIKIAIGSAYPSSDEPEAEIRGRDLLSGLPRTVVVTAAEIRNALDDQVQRIVETVKLALDRTPPELAGDVMDRGIVLTGGGSLLRGLAERLSHETQIPVAVAADPLRSVVLGAGKCIEDFNVLEPLLLRQYRR